MAFYEENPLNPDKRTDLQTAWLQKSSDNLTNKAFKDSKFKIKGDKNIVIKPADKGSSIVIMNRADYLKEGYKQLSDTNFYQ